MSYPRKLWSKHPAPDSHLFAFEKNGRVGFIDQTGHIPIKPTITADIENVGDFSHGLARIDNRAYIDPSGHWALRQKSGEAQDFPTESP